MRASASGRDSIAYWATANLLLHRQNPYAADSVLALETPTRAESAQHERLGGGVSVGARHSRTGWSRRSEEASTPRVSGGARNQRSTGVTNQP
jgi:hypothetical protein